MKLFGIEIGRGNDPAYVRDIGNTDAYTSYDLWGMGFSRKMIDSDLSGALMVKGQKWESSLWDKRKVDAYMRLPLARMHFEAFRAYRSRTEAQKELSNDPPSGLFWPENIIYTVCGAGEERPEDTRDTLEYVLSTLEKTDRAIIEERFRLGRTFAEISSSCGMNPSGVSTAIKKILGGLRSGYAFQMLRHGKNVYMQRIWGKQDSLIFELELSQKQKNVLFLNNLFCVGDLGSLTKKDITHLSHGGKKLAEDVAKALYTFGCPSPFLELPSRSEGDILQIDREIGVISEKYPGRKTELNIVRPKAGSPLYDIRQWSSDRKSMGEGISLDREEAQALYALLGKALSEADGSGRKDGN